MIEKTLIGARLRGAALAIAWLGLGFAVDSNQAFAQPPMPPDPDVLFRSLDTNGDGQLSMADAQPMNRAMLEQIFQTAGKQSTGTVSRTEFQQVLIRFRPGQGTPPGTPPTPGTRPMPPGAPGTTRPTPTGDMELSPILKRLDTNGDGKLTRTEWARVAQMFNLLDANKDNVLDADELMVLGGPPQGPPPDAPPLSLPSTTGVPGENGGPKPPQASPTTGAAPVTLPPSGTAPPTGTGAPPARLPTSVAPTAPQPVTLPPSTGS